MATATANPASATTGRGTAGYGQRFWRWITQKASAAWEWTKDSSAFVWTRGKSMGRAAWGWTRAHAIRAAYWVAGVAKAAWALVLTGIGYVGAAAAWAIGAVISGVGILIGFFGWAGLLVLVGVLAVLAFLSNAFHNYVRLPFRWLRDRNRETTMTQYVRDNRRGPEFEAEDVFTEPAYIAGSVFNINSDGTDDTANDGSLYLLPEEAQKLPKDVLAKHPVLGLMIGEGVRLPVLYNWSSVLGQDSVMETLEYLQGQASTKRERSYWDGRKVAFAAFGGKYEELTGENIQRTWALNAQRHRGSQQPFNSKYHKAGFTDMSAEIQTWVETIRREPVSV